MLWKKPANSVGSTLENLKKSKTPKGKGVEKISRRSNPLGLGAWTQRARQKREKKAGTIFFVGCRLSFVALRSTIAGKSQIPEYSRIVKSL